MLGLAGGPVPHLQEEKEARRAILQAAVAYLDEKQSTAEPQFAEVYQDLSQHYRHRLAAYGEDLGEDEASNIRQLHDRQVDLSRELLQVERQMAVQLRNDRRISDELLRELEHELDLGEARFLAKRVS
jgi:CPA1 family monovalent cation:H+ antiporter